MRVENRENKSEQEKDRRQPAGDFHQHVGRLGAENIFRDPAAKGRAKTFALRALHQDDKHHEERVDDVQPEKNVDQKAHWDGQYDKQMTNVE